MASEYAFREAIKAVIEELTDVKVERYIFYDHEVMFFGTPDQVEIDVVIKSGQLWLMEIKSSISKTEVYAFDRKLIVSPMVATEAREVAQRLGIEVYTAPEDIK